MFYSYNSTEFGNILKSLREDMRLSQTEVSKITKISNDALRRVENGYVTPKLETLVQLSMLYKVNLIKTFAETSKVPDLVSLYSKVSLCIKNSEVQALIDLKNEVDILKEDLYKNGIMLIENYQQFQVFCDASILFIQNKSMLRAKQKAIEALRITHADFVLEEFHKYKYNDFEIRILHLLTIIENRSKNNLLTIRLLEFILSTGETRFSDEETVRNTCLMYFTLSYAYNELLDFGNCLRVADQGIAYALKKNRYNELHLLYYRKGIAEFILKREGYKSSLNKSITLLEIAGNFQLVEIYKKVTLEQYGIEL